MESGKKGENNMNNKTNDYRDLEVWQMSMSLCKKAYDLIHSFPADERAERFKHTVVPEETNVLTTRLSKMFFSM